MGRNTDRLDMLVKDATKYIAEKAKQHEKITFMLEDDIVEDEDDFLALPSIGYVDKHFFYTQYAVLSITFNGAVVSLNCIGRDEQRETKNFSLDELPAENEGAICYLADLVEKAVG